jgi:hypothetical protein
MIGQEPKLTTAAVAAGRNFRGNLLALQGRQPELAAAVAGDLPEVEWVLARDGALTARLEGAWWSGCSLPRRAAQNLLEKMDLKAMVTCFLSPTHAGQVRVTLDRLSAAQALIAVVPDVTDLRLMLCCESFENEIRAGRLWFAWGENWDAELERLLSEQDGLPTPGQFVRTTLVEAERIDAMIRAAQAVFSRELSRRTDAVRGLFAASASVEAERVCVVAPGTFRLWDDAGSVLRDVASENGWGVIDPDDPCRASPVAFARAAAGCGAVVVINVGRADLPAGLPARTKVISWLTGPRIPQFVLESHGDRLLVVDERTRKTAIAAGWPADRVSIAAWPRRQPDSVGRGLGVIANTVALAMPEFGLSSHKVLWESIAREIAQDPFAIGQDPAAYLARWLSGVGIAQETVDLAVFLHQLIQPAYEQGLVRCLIAAGVELRLFGSGWGAIDEFTAHHAGEIHDRAQLIEALDSCAALIHVWPASIAHPIEAAGRPVLRPGSKGKAMWLTEAKRLARGEGRIGPAEGPEMSADVIRRAAGVAQAS